MSVLNYVRRGGQCFVDNFQHWIVVWAFYMCFSFYGGIYTSFDLDNLSSTNFKCAYLYSLSIGFVCAVALYVCILGGDRQSFLFGTLHRHVETRIGCNVADDFGLDVDLSALYGCDYDVCDGEGVDVQ